MVASPYQNFSLRVVVDQVTPHIVTGSLRIVAEEPKVELAGDFRLVNELPGRPSTGLLFMTPYRHVRSCVDDCLVADRLTISPNERLYSSVLQEPNRFSISMITVSSSSESPSFRNFHRGYRLR